MPGWWARPGLRSSSGGTALRVADAGQALVPRGHGQQVEEGLRGGALRTDRAAAAAAVLLGYSIAAVAGADDGLEVVEDEAVGAGVHAAGGVAAAVHRVGFVVGHGHDGPGEAF